MTRNNLYRYEREPGKWTTSPIEPPEGTEYTLMYRLIADEGKVLTKDGENFVGCVDTTAEEAGLWYEVDDTEEATEQDYINALHEFGAEVQE